MVLAAPCAAPNHYDIKRTLAVANADLEHAIAAFAGDPGAQQGLFDAHQRVKRAFPLGLKEAIADRFGTSPVTRLG